MNVLRRLARIFHKPVPAYTPRHARPEPPLFDPDMTQPFGIKDVTDEY